MIDELVEKCEYSPTVTRKIREKILKIKKNRTLKFWKKFQKLLISNYNFCNEIALTFDFSRAVDGRRTLNF